MSYGLNMVILSRTAGGCLYLDAVVVESSPSFVKLLLTDDKLLDGQTTY